MTAASLNPLRPTCDCGSGLANDRCCGLDASRPWPAADHSAAVARARAAITAGDFATGERDLIACLEQTPTDLAALGLLYELRTLQGRAAAAEVLLRRVVRLDPFAPSPAVTLALLLFRKGALAEAELQTRAVLRMAPNQPLAHNLMGMIMTEAHQPRVGEGHYRRAMQLLAKPGADLLTNLAWNLKTQGRIEEARGFYQQALALDPKRFNTLYGWARTEEADRQYVRAGQLLDLAEQAAPGHPHVAVQRAVLLARGERYEAALAALDDLERKLTVNAPPGGVDKGLMLEIWNERGPLLDRMGRYKDAFDAFSQAKRLMRETTGQTYLADDAAALAGRLTAFFSPPRVNILPHADVRTDSPQPIFILGFPRSGTTMIEQTLSAHPSISAGDELPIISELLKQAPNILRSAWPYPEALGDLSASDPTRHPDRLRDYYLRRARELGAIQPGRDWFTDKMPLNETHMGMISLMFPAAPLIHLLRHPLDVVLSVYANQLTHGFYCADALASAARHYVLVADLVEHYWLQMSPRYLAIRYEDIIDDQETKVSEMLAFIGAPFDAACLNFHQNRRFARTASYAQVSEKLYDRSRYRYRRYLDQLAPVIPILEPVIRRLGYSIG